MAAPSIPNLNTLRPRTGLRGRGRGRGASDSNGPRLISDDGPLEVEAAAARRDTIIQQTDGDASSSRMSAVALHYLDDPFARPFITTQIAKRYPIINRGTYVRTTAIDRLVDRFLHHDVHVKKQIVSLGAGSDTRFFRRSHVKNLVYHELDFAANTKQKIAVIERTPALLHQIHQSLDHPSDLRLNEQKTALTSPTYNIHSLDLRSLIPDPDSANAAITTLPNLDPTAPTLVLSECCLCYLPPDATVAILRHLTTTLLPMPTPVALVLYEPIRPYDGFGRTMVANLASRGIHLQTLERYHSLRVQRDRLNQAGFIDGQGARDVATLYSGQGDADDEWIGPTERHRIDRLEWLDEVEEWELLARHYCVAWGWRDGPLHEHDSAAAPADAAIFTKAWGSINGGWTESEKGDDELS